MTEERYPEFHRDIPPPGNTYTKERTVWRYIVAQDVVEFLLGMPERPPPFLANNNMTREAVLTAQRTAEKEAELNSDVLLNYASTSGASRWRPEKAPQTTMRQPSSSTSMPGYWRS